MNGYQNDIVYTQIWLRLLHGNANVSLETIPIISLSFHPESDRLALGHNVGLSSDDGFF